MCQAHQCPLVFVLPFLLASLLEAPVQVLFVVAVAVAAAVEVAPPAPAQLEERTTFAQISTESGRDLKMTMNHYLPAGACALSTLPMVTASQVTAGDCVQTVTGREQVVSVSKVEGKGIYTIIAMEELIVVNGIVATPYGGINPTLVNIYYNLHRLAYTAFAGKMVGHGWLQKATEGLWSGLSALAALSA